MRSAHYLFVWDDDAAARSAVAGGGKEARRRRARFARRERTLFLLDAPNLATHRARSVSRLDA
jgi:hypothetical protein